jgi:hypothetical protein
MIEDESAPYDMRIHSNPSALAWTKFFREHNPECNLDDDVMLGWFANAMMAMHDHIYQTTQPAQEQEPVAWMNESGSCFLSDGNKYSDLWTPLYTAPPKREPLGTQVSFKDSSGKLITVDISFVRELVERDSEVSSEGTWHRKGYKDRSWGI